VGGGGGKDGAESTKLDVKKAIRSSPGKERIRKTCTDSYRGGGFQERRVKGVQLIVIKTFCFVHCLKSRNG